MTHSAINPLDGRYSEKTQPLTLYFSEQALMKYRIIMEGEYLIALSGTSKTHLKKISAKEIAQIRSLYDLSVEDFKKIKEIEKSTNHDVKAVEYFLKEKLSETTLKDSLEWVHFALTSEDTNNIAYALLLRDSLEKEIIPKLEEIISNLNKLAVKYKNLPMLARTHGQSASPTTFGKEMFVFVTRLQKRIEVLKNIKIEAKLNGATGNYNAHNVAYPNIDWISFSKKFIDTFNKGHKQALATNLITTQIECHDSYVAVFDVLRQINTILLDFNQDIWRYISDGWIGQIPKAGETGSSTMPHKVNPIDFENSEGNLGIANALLEFFARKLPISRLQRDLSDSTTERSFGTAFGHSYLAYVSLLKGLNKISVNETKIKEALWAHPEVIAEALQTVLRRENYPVPYESLKELTRGKNISMQDFEKFIDGLKVSPKVKQELKKITPENYTGLASKLVK
ncbi:adenylosuccinate lyase [Candidatus Nomurabacteria bacterium]|nr:adenylosuccinate lyase [Candidatus Nomurabacteria bacterium]